MIQVNYLGTLGNNMWQFAVGRILAEKNNLKLLCRPIPGFSKTKELVNGKIIHSPQKRIEGHIIDLDEEVNEKIILDGYFQRYEYIKNYKKEVYGWFELNAEPPSNLKRTI